MHLRHASIQLSIAVGDVDNTPIRHSPFMISTHYFVHHDQLYEFKLLSQILSPSYKCQYKHLKKCPKAMRPGTPSFAYAFNNLALIATMIVLILINTAPTAGLSTILIGARTP